MSALPPITLLHGVTIVEVTTSLRGAFAGACLRDLGASVTRIDLGRPRPGVPDSCDDGKIVVTAGPDEVALLLAGADVVIEDQDDDWVAQLAARSPARPVTLSVTGLGRTAECANPPELCVQAESGVMWSIGADGGRPQPVPEGAASTLAGINGACAALWLLFLREMGRSGGPLHADVAEADVIAAQTGTYQMIRQYHNRAPWQPHRVVNDGGPGCDLILGALVQAIDGPVYVQINTPEQVKRLHALLPEEFRVAIPTYVDGLRHRSVFHSWVARFAAAHTRAELLAIAEDNGLVIAALLELEDLDVGGVLPLLRSSADEVPQLPRPWLVENAAC